MSTAEVASHLRENPFELAKTQLRKVGEVFGIDPNLIRVLLERGYSEADVAKIAGENLLRVWTEVERAAESS